VWKRLWATKCGGRKALLHCLRVHQQSLTMSGNDFGDEIQRIANWRPAMGIPGVTVQSSRLRTVLNTIERTFNAFK
jgi:hypothetical protein